MAGLRAVGTLGQPDKDATLVRLVTVPLLVLSTAQECLTRWSGLGRRYYAVAGLNRTNPIGSSPVLMRATTANSTMSMATTSLRPVTVT